MLDEKLLEILACPKCKGEVKYLKEKNIILCENCKVYYEIKEDIPVMLPEEAKPFEEAENS